MAASNAAQLNMGYMNFYTAMLAKLPKPKRGAAVKQNDAEAVANIFGFNQTAENPTKAKNTGAKNFIPKNGKMRYSGTQLKMIAFTLKMRSKYGDFGRLTHAMYERELNISHVTVNHNLAQLRSDNVLQRENGVNDYYINPELWFSEEDYITIYEFLLEANDFGGKVIKELNFNAVLLLCFILRHYYNIKEKSAKAGKNNITPEDAYFVGSKQRVASLLNIAESTANDAIWELLDTGHIYRKAFYIDDNCNEIICDGKGNRSDKQTVFILNKKVIRLCDKVRAKMDTAKKKRAKKVEKAAQKAERKEARESYRQSKRTARNRLSKAEQRQRDFEILTALYNEDEEEKISTEEFILNSGRSTQSSSRRSVTEEWAGTLKRLREQNGKPPEPFDEFSQRPPTDESTK